MDGPPLRKVTPGEEFAPSARAWNRFVDAADFEARSRGRLPTDFLTGGLDPTTIWVKNLSGVAVGQYGVLSLSGQSPLITASANPAAFKAPFGVTMGGIAPTGGGEPFVVMLDPLAAGDVALGRGVLAGAVQCQVNVTDATHGFAETASGDVAKLVSRADGNNAARILWKESGTGTKWAVVLLPVLREPASSAFSGARVYNPGNQTPGVGPFTLLFSLERYDTDAYHDVTSNTERLTVPTSARYRIGVGLEWSAPAVSVKTRIIAHTGGSDVVIAQDIRSQPAAMTAPSVGLVTDYLLNASDYVIVSVTDLTSSGAVVNGAGNYSSEFWIQKVG